MAVGLINIKIIVKSKNKMEELYYVPSSKVNSKVADLVIDGNHIEIKGITYQRLSRKPRGRSIKRKLKGLETETSILIY